MKLENVKFVIGSREFKYDEDSLKQAIENFLSTDRKYGPVIMSNEKIEVDNILSPCLENTGIAMENIKVEGMELTSDVQVLKTVHGKLLESVLEKEGEVLFTLPTIFSLRDKTQITHKILQPTAVIKARRET